MNKTLRYGIHFGDSSDEESEKHANIDYFNPKKDDILMLPWSVKLTTPYLIFHFPDLIEFLRHDLKNYPNLKHKENAPYPYPFLEVYNIEGRLLHEVNLAFKTRAQLNQILQSYNQLPKDSLHWLVPPPRALEDRNCDIGQQYQPPAMEEPGVRVHQKRSEVSTVGTDFSVMTPETVISD